jgi:hypothetical protein
MNSRRLPINEDLEMVSLRAEISSLDVSECAEKTTAEAKAGNRARVEYFMIAQQVAKE